MEWEYLVFEQLKDLEKRECAFNYLGGNRWELVAVDGGTVYFKRPIPIGISLKEDKVGSDKALEVVKEHFGKDFMSLGQRLQRDVET